MYTSVTSTSVFTFYLVVHRQESSAIYGDDMLDDPIYNPDVAVGQLSNLFVIFY